MEEELTMQGNLEINKKECYVLVSVNPKIYALDVVLSSAYNFIDNCYVLVDGDPIEELVVELRPKDKSRDVEELGRDFNNELINYANYAVQALKNAKLREAILNRVLSTQSSEKIDSDSSDYLEKEAKPWKFEDTEKISVPWEEQDGKDKNKQNE